MNFKVGFISLLFAPITLIGQQSSVYLPIYSNSSWTNIPSLSNPYEEGRILPLRCVAGGNQYGMIQVGGQNGQTVRYITNYSTGNWTYIADAPFAVTGVTGDNSHGAIVYGVAPYNQSVAYINDYSSGVWHVLPNAPISIVSIAGNNSTGVVIAGGYNNSEIYYMPSYGSGVWYKAPSNAPFPIKGIAGDIANGIVAFGGTNSDQVAYLVQLNIGSWVKLPTPPATPIWFIGGNNYYGPLILAGIGSPSSLYYLANYANPVWGRGANCPLLSPVGLIGDNHFGAAAAGNWVH